MEILKNRTFVISRVDEEMEIHRDYFSCFIIRESTFVI